MRRIIGLIASLTLACLLAMALAAGYGFAQDEEGEEKPETSKKNAPIEPRRDVHGPIGGLEIRIQ